MNKKNLFAAGLAMLMGLPAAAQDGGVVINGSIIDWYYYGRDIHDGTTGWNQQTTGQGTAQNPFNYGLISLGANAAAEDGKPVWVADFPIRNHILYSNSGGVFTGDAYYSFFMSEQGWEDNMESEYGSETYLVKVRRWTWDEGYQNVKYEQVATMTTQPIDLTYDPLYDVVYGIFYSGGGYKIGTLDMQTFQVNYISREAISGFPRCIAVNSKGELYLIDAGGYLYKVIDMTDGTLQTVGSVGFKSQNRMMSATFDLRTDRLYWVGYANSGKIEGASGAGTNETLPVADGGRDTGIYEVNTETGQATLIGLTDFADVDMTDPLNPKVNKYGKMQLTGIYVDGCFERRDIDLVATLQSAPLQVLTGGQGQVVVTVRNIGRQRVLAKDYVVRLYADGQLVATIDRDNEQTPLDNLNAGQSQTLTIPFTATKAGQLTLSAEVVSEADQEQRNNSTRQQTVVVVSDQVLPAPIVAGESRLGSIKLTWTDPQGLVTDGAEQYAAFAYDQLGQWTMVDGDKGYTQSPSSWNESISYPNANTPKAFIVFDPEKAGVNLTGSAEMFRPHSGNQSFAAFFTAVPDDSEAGGHQVPNQDYMVSPLLSGEAQTISFWAKGYKGSVATGYETTANYTERMRVLYTTGEGLDPTAADYTVLADTFTVDNTAWTQYSFELPAGATHFALECCSSEGFVLMVDDVQFSVKPLEVTAYNVYRNGELVAQLAADATSWNSPRGETVADGDAFTVTAVYATGESAPSNVMSINYITGIDNVASEGRQSTVADGVYDLNGRIVSGQARRGIYVVKRNGKTTKVIIR